MPLPKLQRTNDLKLPVRLSAREVIEISDDMTVIPGVLFKEREWNLRPPDNPRMEHIPDAEVVLRWDIYCAEMPPQLENDLKIYAYILIKHYGLLLEKGPLHPKTIVIDVRNLAKFFYAAYSACGVTMLSDFTKSVCFKAVGKEGAHLSLRAALKRLIHPEMQKVLRTGPLSLSNNDVGKLNYRGPRPESGYQTLPTDLFFVLSSVSEGKIAEFMKLAEIDRTSSKSAITLQQCFPANLTKLLEMLQVLKTDRHELKTYGKESGSRSELLALQRSRFVSRFGVEKGIVYEYIDNAQMAAIAVIFLYTGFRYGAGITLKIGCIKVTNGFFEIVGTDNKNKRQTASVNHDRWVATPLMVDAVKILEHFAFYMDTDNLFLSVNKIGNNENRKMMTNKTLNDRFKRYLERIDFDGTYQGWNLHCHQFREGLTYQLIRAGAKLPYISMQLKHITYAAAQLSNDLPSEVTLRYGNMPKALLAGATGELRNRVSEEIAESLWGEKKRFAGGGAEKHVQRTEAFFQGMGLSGEERAEYIRNRAKQGIPLFVTGTGVCNKNFSSPEKVLNSPPPCLGDLHCNPFDCDNAITPETHRTAIEKRLSNAQTKALEAVDVGVREFHSSLATRYQAMLSQLDGTVNHECK